MVSPKPSVTFFCGPEKLWPVWQLFFYHSGPTPAKILGPEKLGPEKVGPDWLAFKLNVSKLKKRLAFNSKVISGIIAIASAILADAPKTQTRKRTYPSHPWSKVMASQGNPLHYNGNNHLLRVSSSSVSWILRFSLYKNISHTISSLLQASSRKLQLNK